MRLQSKPADSWAFNGRFRGIKNELLIAGGLLISNTQKKKHRPDREINTSDQAYLVNLGVFLVLYNKFPERYEMIKA